MKIKSITTALFFSLLCLFMVSIKSTYAQKMKISKKKLESMTSKSKTMKTQLKATPTAQKGKLTKTKDMASQKGKVKQANKFDVFAQSFADLQVLRYRIPEWEKLSFKEQSLAYYLSQAILSGRDIIYDQRGKYNLTIRKTIEAIWNNPKTIKKGSNWEKFKVYSGRFWFSNGNHHHYSNHKFVPKCSFEYFAQLVKLCDPKTLPLQHGESVEAFLKRIKPIIFNPSVNPMMVNLNKDADKVATSSNNFYHGVTQKQVEKFYAQFPDTGREPEWGINGQLINTADYGIKERKWKVGGMYGKAIEKIVYWLKKAIPFAENDQQAKSLELLIKYYETGSPKAWDQYNIAWVQYTDGNIDLTNGFIEVYNDAMGIKGSYEGIVSMVDSVATKRINKIASNAQWFENHSPIMPQDKKKKVKGITAKAIDVIMEAGDATPSTPIGINLPNSDWIRKEYGSKSVSLTNIIHSYNISKASSGVLQEFVDNPKVQARIKKYGSLAGNLHTDMHECIGHASGKLRPGVATPDKTLKSYASTLEEARADLVGLYFILDSKLVKIGVMPSLEVGKAEYDQYMLNGLLTQLKRVKPGHNLEEAHMRDRSLIAHWVYDHGIDNHVVELAKKDGKTYVHINDYDKLRHLFGQLLRKIQTIKSTGDYEAGKKLVETYGVKVNQTLLKEVHKRYDSLHIKPYSGFIQPRIIPVVKDNGDQVYQIAYPANFFQQMLYYGKHYSFLPPMN